MKNWDEAEERGSECSAREDRRMAHKVCQQLQIPLHEVDFVSQYWQRVFMPFTTECAQGLTPNPDLTCNRQIKVRHSYADASTHSFRTARCISWTLELYIEVVLLDPVIVFGTKTLRLNTF